MTRPETPQSLGRIWASFEAGPDHVPPHGLLLVLLTDATHFAEPSMVALVRLAGEQPHLGKDCKRMSVQCTGTSATHCERYGPGGR